MKCTLQHGYMFVRRHVPEFSEPTEIQCGSIAQGMSRIERLMDNAFGFCNRYSLSNGKHPDGYYARLVRPDGSVIVGKSAIWPEYREQFRFDLEEEQWR